MMFSPYPWHYTLRWPIYYRWPSLRNHTRMQRVPDQYTYQQGVESTLRLLFCGDIMVQNQDVAPLLHHDLCALIRSADLFIGNCEAPLGNHQPDNQVKYGFNFHMPRRYLEDIISQTGLPPARWLLSTANNHIGDKGHVAYDDTYSILADMGVTPLGRHTEGDQPFSIYESNGLRIGFVAWTEWLNRPIFADQKGILRQEHVLNQDWRDIKSFYQLDYLFGLPHWEYEFQHFPGKSTRSLARNLINEKGIDFLVGAHTHTLQPMEWFEHGVCAYNLGNFCGYAGAWSVNLIPVLEVNLTDAVDQRLHSYRLHYYYQQKIANKNHIIPLHLAPANKHKKLKQLIYRLYDTVYE